MFTRYTCSTGDMSVHFTIADLMNISPEFARGSVSNNPCEQELASITSILSLR